MNDLVCIQHRAAVTTTRIIADVFDKKHKDVLRTIDNLLPELPENWRRNFTPRDYVERGKSWPMYEMNRDAFSLLINGFTGKKALFFRCKFIDAFNCMEKALLQQHDPSWQQQNLEGKMMRRGLTDVLSVFVEYATSQGSKNAPHYYQNITKMTYKALMLVNEASPASRFRDMLDTMQTTFLAAAECIALQALVDGMQQQLPYKEIYVLVRDKVTSYAATLPLQRMICSKGAW